VFRFAQILCEPTIGAGSKSALIASSAMWRPCQLELQPQKHMIAPAHIIETVEEKSVPALIIEPAEEGSGEIDSIVETEVERLTRYCESCEREARKWSLYRKHTFNCFTLISKAIICSGYKNTRYGACHANSQRALIFPFVSCYFVCSILSLSQPYKII
jgi:hypothetical protein